MVAWVAVGMAGVVYVLITKLRKAKGRERAQVKYILLGLTLFAVVSVLLGLIVPMLTGSYEYSYINTFSSLLLVGFAAYAMVKYRFLDIRFVVMRAAGFALLITGLAAVLVAVAAFARQDLVRSLGIDSEYLFVPTTLLVVFAFQPLVNGIERVTDRVFYRRTYDPQGLLGHLGSVMASIIDADELAQAIANELATGMALTNAAVVFEHGDKLEAVGSDGPVGDCAELESLMTNRFRQAVFTDDPSTDPDTASLLEGREARVLVPLNSEGVLVGFMLLGAKQSGEMFTSQDAMFLGILGSEVAVSVKKALLLDERNQRVRELSALNTLAWALGRDTHFDAVLNRALSKVMEVTSAEAGSIMLFDPGRRSLSIEASCGLSDDVVANTNVRIGEGIAGWVAEHRKPLILVDADDSAFGGELERQGLRAALSVPLVAKGMVIGVLNVSKAESAEAFSRENLKIVSSFAGQLAMAIENARLYVDLENTFLGTIGALAAAVDAKDPYTYGHSNEVTEHALVIAGEIGMSEAERENLRIAALLHDIGKIGIDSGILNKPGKLTADEYQVIRSHPDIAANILGSLDFLREVVPLVQHHHERWDGGGYPTGLVGASIPKGARIISVADAFNAMTADRPYRKALSREEAVRELLDNAGTQFDPAIVSAFVGWLVKTGAVASDVLEQSRRPALRVVASKRPA
jgi:putative nucleotidyltransferase with HDIG domain